MVPRGVVQLFNAVQKHQKNVDEKVKEAGSSIRKRAKLMSTISKKDFISVLRGMDGSASEKASTRKSSQAKQVRLLYKVQGLGLPAFTLDVFQRRTLPSAAYTGRGTRCQPSRSRL